MLDLSVVGATVVTPEGPRSVDVGVVGEKISLISEPGGLPAAQKTIDATGLIMLPGGIDPHIHTIRPKGMTGQGRQLISRAGLYGGMTTIIDFVPADPGPVAAIEATIEEWEGTCYTNYAFHVHLNDSLSDEQIGEIPQLIEKGFPSFKVFTTNIKPGREGHMTSGGTLHEIMELAAAHGGIVDVHAEDDELVMHEYRKHNEAGKTDLIYMQEVHSILSEDLSFNRTLRMATYVEGAPIYFHHVTAKVGVDAIREYRNRGIPVYGETLLPLTLVTAKSYAEPDGERYHLYPSLKWEEDVEALWDGVADRSIHTFGTDGACPTWEDKMGFRGIETAYGGVTGVEPKMPILYTEMILNRGFGLKRLAEVTSENAAKIFGMYPKKGAIAVGSDADLVILDPAETRVIDPAAMHEGNFSPWTGRTVSGWATHTVLNGALAVERDLLLSDRMAGKLVRRTLDPAVAKGTVLD
jgi:dihydropyrimidinase